MTEFRLYVAFACIATSSVGALEWPQFRGPDGHGHAAAKGLPSLWDDTTNVAWSEELPGRGHSSPILTQDHIWLTTATADGTSMRILRLNRRTGRLSSNVELFRQPKDTPLHKKNTYATPTPVTDGHRVFVHFGSVGTACVSIDNEVIWRQSDLDYQQPYSGASSPVLSAGRVLLNCDGEDRQFVVGLDAKTGRVEWQTPRTHFGTGRRMAYATPLVLTVDGRTELVSPGADQVAAFDVETGKELWWLPYDGFSEVAVPVSHGGLVFVTAFEEQSRPTLFAIRPGGSGDISQSRVAWKKSRGGVPHVPSPLIIGDALYLIDDTGIATCLELTTGTPRWQKRIGGNFSASPIYADGKIFACREDGTTFVLKPGPEFQLLGENGLGGRIMASPAAAGNNLLIRTERKLYCIRQTNSEVLPVHEDRR